MKGSSASTARPPWTSRSREIGAPPRRSRSRPRAARWRRASMERNSPHTLCRGSAYRSSSRTGAPEAARWAAAAPPARPPPDDQHLLHFRRSTQSRNGKRQTIATERGVDPREPQQAQPVVAAEAARDGDRPVVAHEGVEPADPGDDLEAMIGQRVTVQIVDEPAPARRPLHPAQKGDEFVVGHVVGGQRADHEVDRLGAGEGVCGAEAIRAAGSVRAFAAGALRGLRS